MMAEALAKQKDNIIKKQVVWGKEFTGTPFISNPHKLWFKDFDVGTVYKKSFQLTNVSYTFNSFKLLVLPDEYRDFFEIDYIHPGAMSAGVSCRLQITFEPKLEQDIITELPFLAETGPFTVPLHCTIKRAK